MPKRKALTKAQAMRARDWAMGHLGLQGWKITLWWQSEMPSWAMSQNGEPADGGYYSMSTQYRTADVWINLKQCDDDPEWGRLEVLMHEMIHIGCNACNFESKFHRAGEFLTDRFANALAYAYCHKMKPWRK